MSRTNDLTTEDLLVIAARRIKRRKASKLNSKALNAVHQALGYLWERKRA